MDKYNKLAGLFKDIQTPQSMQVLQGVVVAVNGLVCSVDIGDLTVEDVRLRASTIANNKQILLTPKVGSVVIVGCLDTHYSELVVLSCDEIDKIDITGTITLNGGELGGLVKVDDLVSKLNTVEQDLNTLKSAFSSWVVVPQDGGAALKAALASYMSATITKTKKSDLENTKVKH